MKTYKELFAQLKRPALIPFFVIGDPDFETSLEIVKRAIDAGADILELGIPFSDPIADGAVIQKADVRALGSGMTVAKAIDFIRLIKQYKDIPIGLLLYYNLVYQKGVEEFFTCFHQAGVNSILIADLSIDDADEIAPAARKAGLDTVFMVTPNTDEQRIRRIASQTSGFIYAVSLLGVTGVRESLSDTVGSFIKKLKRLTGVPICVGFGISKPQHAAAVALAGADGIIIGSRIVGIIEETIGNKEKMLSEIANFITDIKSAIKKR
jgi:tryptophan synthase alpha chain